MLKKKKNLTEPKHLTSSVDEHIKIIYKTMKNMP